MSWKCPHCKEKLSEEDVIKSACSNCKKIFETPMAVNTASSQPPPNPQQSDSRKISGLAVASLVLGIFPVIPVVGSILAIVFAVKAQNIIKQAPVNYKGEKLATAGLILGILAIVVMLFSIMAGIRRCSG